MSDVKKYKLEQETLFAIQDEFDQAEADAKIIDLAKCYSVLYKIVLKTGFFDEATAANIATDLTQKLRPDLVLGASQTATTIQR